MRSSNFELFYDDKRSDVNSREIDLRVYFEINFDLQKISHSFRSVTAIVAYCAINLFPLKLRGSQHDSGGHERRAST